MGKEWLYWVGGGSKSSKRGRRTLISNHHHHVKADKKEEEALQSGSASCMCAVLQLFDLHHFQLHSHSLLQQQQREDEETDNYSSTLPKGVEAPRNSLELDESQSPMDEGFNVPMGIRIRTGRENKSPRASTSDYISSEICNSPGIKTPSLVARLMGLDLLPDQSPSPSLSSHSRPGREMTRKRTLNSRGTRSLPETPRVSSDRKSEVDHRLSLQINKENNFYQELEFQKPGTRRYFKKEDAKKIAKQIKENACRKFGADITNTIRNGDQIVRRDEHLVLLKQPAQKIKELPTEKCSSSVKKKKANPQASDAIRNKKEEPFIRSTKSNLSDKKCKKITPLSNELLNVSVPTAVLSVKKEHSKPITASPVNVKLVKYEDGICKIKVSDAHSSKKSTQLSSSSSPSYDQKTFNQENIKQDKSNGAATSGDRDYSHYIQKILKRTGIIDNGTPLSLAKWYSFSHPLDPSIFHHLELLHPATIITTTAGIIRSPKKSEFLNRRCNRKLIFQLLDELLVEILKPRTTHKYCRLYGSDLIDKLCKKIQSFPSANCQFLEDIDALIDTDLCKSSLNGFYEEEDERIVAEVERRILDSLVHETVTVLFQKMRFRTV